MKIEIQNRLFHLLKSPFIISICRSCIILTNCQGLAMSMSSGKNQIKLNLCQKKKMLRMRGKKFRLHGNFWVRFSIFLKDEKENETRRWRWRKSEESKLFDSRLLLWTHKSKKFLTNYTLKTPSGCAALYTFHLQRF